MNNLDKALKSHFSQREEVPAETKLALRAKLHDSLNRPEKLRIVWLLAPCMLFTAFTILFAVEMFFGLSAAIIVCVGYYVLATLGGMAVLMFMLVTKKSQSDVLSGCARLNIYIRRI